MRAGPPPAVHTGRAGSMGSVHRRVRGGCGCVGGASCCSAMGWQTASAAPHLAAPTCIPVPCWRSSRVVAQPFPWHGSTLTTAQNGLGIAPHVPAAALLRGRASAGSQTLHFFALPPPAGLLPCMLCPAADTAVCWPLAFLAQMAPCTMPACWQCWPPSPPCTCTPWSSTMRATSLQLGSATGNPSSRAQLRRPATSSRENSRAGSCQGSSLWCWAACRSA